MESRWEFFTHSDQLHVSALITKGEDGVFELSWDIRKTGSEGTILEHSMKWFESADAAELDFRATATKIPLDQSRIIFRAIEH